MKTGTEPEAGPEARRRLIVLNVDGGGRTPYPERLGAAVNGETGAADWWNAALFRAAARRWPEMTADPGLTAEEQQGIADLLAAPEDDPEAVLDAYGEARMAGVLLGRLSKELERQGTGVLVAYAGRYGDARQLAGGDGRLADRLERGLQASWQRRALSPLCRAPALRRAEAEQVSGIARRTPAAGFVFDHPVDAEVAPVA